VESSQAKCLVKSTRAEGSSRVGSNQRSSLVNRIVDWVSPAKGQAESAQDETWVEPFKDEGRVKLTQDKARAEPLRAEGQVESTNTNSRAKST